MVLSFVLLSLASLGIITTMPLFWSIPTGYLKGAAAAGGIAFINSLGLTGGFVSPFVLGMDQDQHREPGPWELAHSWGDGGRRAGHPRRGASRHAARDKGLN